MAAKKKPNRRGGAPQGNQNALGNDGGRPTKFKKEYAKKLMDYFRKHPPTTIRVETYHYKNGESKEKEIEVPNMMPTFEEFADEIDVMPDTLTDWAKKGEGKEADPEYVEFSRSYKKCKGIQKKFMYHNALIGNYNAKFAIFFSTNNLGLKEKSEQELTHKGGDLTSFLRAADQLEKDRKAGVKS